MKSISSWLCTNNTKNLFVKIVHPGGHVELHDRPILARELLNRNPKCCVAHPNVFQQPYAIVSPETLLMLGQKYYVVPLGTIRKLQVKYPRSLFREKHRENDLDKENTEKTNDCDDSERSACWLFRNSKNGAREEKGENGCLKSMSSGIRSKGSFSKSSSEDTSKTSRQKSDNDKNSSGGVGNGGSSSPGRLSLASIDNWQPGLESVIEEVKD
ncbi:hypothetical protein BUALT_Bualt02G0105700 [Buddleja alternifolia]|uniref:Uncharacterized protein n=1 Tax=Buddleja alternifolia TaxID=168488 RepID=A0AAV6YA85_9LAMI|nr:hypothetical protein BUALT_Bualt02G0105700 [Buddleja alternifolia]